MWEGEKAWEVIPDCEDSPIFPKTKDENEKV
jgi:hypothetical protein